jgi:hypothetical protein
MSDTETVRVLCNTCDNRTRHRKLAATHTVVNFEECDIRDPVDGEQVMSEAPSGETTFDLLQCMGCDSVTVVVHDRSFAYEESQTTTFYPPRVFRRLPKWHDTLPDDLGLLLHQVYTSLRAGHGALALMGARAVVDMVLSDKVGDKGTFANKLEAMLEFGLVGARGKELLLAALDAGNAAAHRGFNPSTETVSEVMDIVENLLETTYRLDGLAERLKATTPRRSRSVLRPVPPKDESA